jgi:hypothetical protein
MIISLKGTDDSPICEKEFVYNEEDIWNRLKEYKKAMKKKGVKVS